MAEGVTPDQQPRSSVVHTQSEDTQCDQKNMATSLLNDEKRGCIASTRETGQDTDEQISNLPHIPIQDTHLKIPVEKQICEKTFLGAVLKGFSFLTEDDALCDITLVVEGMQFKCHKVILVTFSEYFQAIFTIGMKETDQEVIHLTGFRAATIRKMIMYIYKGYAGFTANDARELLEAAVFFRVESLRYMCELALSSALDLQNVKTLWRTAKRFPECNSLRKSCEDYLLRYFDRLKEDDIRDLDKEELVFLISNHNLLVSNEDTVYQAARIWFEYDGDLRKQYLADVFQHIRQPFISKELYSDFMTNFSFFAEPAIKPFIEEALKYQKHPSCRMDELSTRTTLRHNYDMKKVLLVIGFKQSFACTNPRMWAWRFDCDMWYELKSAPFKLGQGYATCRFGESEIYFSGGQGRSTFEKFDGLTDTVVPCTHMKTARMSHCMACVSDSIYVLGGNGFQFDREDTIPKEDKLESVDVWRPSENTWRHCGNIMVPVSGATSCVSGRVIFLYGGFRDQNNEEPSNLTQFFDTKTNSGGYLLTKLPFRCQNLKAATVSGATYILAKNNIYESKDELEYTNVESIRQDDIFVNVLQPSSMTNDVKSIYIIQESYCRHVPYPIDRSFEMQRYKTEIRALEKVSEKMQFLKNVGSMHTLVVAKSILHRKPEVPTTFSLLAHQ